MRKLIFLLTIVLFIIPLKSQAADIIDGDLIRASNTLDVYIVKLINEKKFKRLILNPEIFNQYGHLKWEDIKDVSQSTVDECTTSDLVRAVEDEKVYKLYPDNDVGEKRWIKTADDFLDLGYDWDAIYNINSFERDAYSTGEDLEAPTLPEEEQEEEEEEEQRDPITINVPSDYSTIQAAIDAAIDGDTIFVAEGIYNENIVIDKGIKIIGETVTITIIDGGGTDSAITINNGENILIQKLTIRSQDKYGIYCQSENSATVTFKNNYIIDSKWGIVAENNCQITVLNNLIYNNKNSVNTDGAGILIKNNFSYEITSEIRNNTIDDNYHGIWSEDSNLSVLNNIITNHIGEEGTVESTGIYHSGQGESDNIYNNTWKNSDNYGGNATAGNGSIIVDPKFVWPSLRNYNLKTGTSGSPCIDAGYPEFIYRDGILITSANYRNDMGAYGGPDNIYWQI